MTTQPDLRSNMIDFLSSFGGDVNTIIQLDDKSLNRQFLSASVDWEYFQNVGM